MDALLDYGSESEDSEDKMAERSESDMGPHKQKVTETRYDFFGLHSSNKSLLGSSVGKGCLSDSEPTTPKRHFLEIAQEKVEVDLPGTSFWNDASIDEVQVLKGNAEFVGRNVKDSHQLIKSRNRHVQKVHNSDDNYSNIKRSRLEGESNRTELSSVDISKEYEKRKMYYIHPRVASFIHKGNVNNKIPSQKEWSNPGHAGATNRLQWNIQNYSHLLVSCSMDSTVKIWNIWSQLEPCVQVLKVHTKAVRDVNWSHDGKQLLSCSYDKSAIVTEVETGIRVHKLEHTSYVTCCKYHPVNQHLSVTGANSEINTWDNRRPSIPCRTFTYKDNFGQVEDLMFTQDGSQLFSCSDLVSRDSADRNVMAWDFATGTVLSNQIYQERYTVTRLGIHPWDNQLLAQSNGNYIALFSLQRPYKMNKHKRFGCHKVEGYNIGFDISPDGQLVYSGSADGKVYCYNYQKGIPVQTISTGLPIILDVVCHPVLPSTLAMSSWDGTVQVWK